MQSLDPIAPPGYPSVAGQAQPDLNLAGVDMPMTELSPMMGGHFTDSTPPQNLGEPALKNDGDADSVFDDIHQAGTGASLPYQDLNLAGCMAGFPPSPDQLGRPTVFDPGFVNAPTFMAPNFGVPDLKPGNLTGPGLDQLPAFQPDPQMADLLQFDRPKGLDTSIASETMSGMVHLQPDPDVPDLEDYDHPNGLGMPGPLLVDPNLPDLQSPQLTQDVHMQGRPGDLSQSALDVMHSGATYSQAGEYPSVQMDQSDMNNRRRRHFTLMDRGLDAEESGRSM